MSKTPTAPTNPLFSVKVPILDEHGDPVHDSKKNVMTHTICMADATLPDGTPQRLYYPEGHPHAGVFRGMAELLIERGYDSQAVRKLRAQCKKFECPSSYPSESIACCCRRLLYNEPDFAGVESILEAHCKKSGFQVIFLPKFHCELNPIEQCWGYAKYEYRQYPLTTGKGTEAALERNVVKALNTVPLESIRKYAHLFYMHRILRLLTMIPDSLFALKGLWMPTAVD